MSEATASSATTGSVEKPQTVVTTTPIVKEKNEANNGIAAALARSLTRGVAIYFSRPVRLFRPAKGEYHCIFPICAFTP